MPRCSTEPSKLPGINGPAQDEEGVIAICPSAVTETAPSEGVRVKEEQQELVRKRREARRAKREQALAEEGTQIAQSAADSPPDSGQDASVVSNSRQYPYWEPLTNCVGETPRVRSGHTACIYRSRFLYIFGGFDGQQCFDDLYQLDLHSLAWSKVEGHGDKPSGRASHTAASDELAGSMFVFGGSGSHFGYTNKCDLYEFAYDTSTWSLLCEVGISTVASSLRPTSATDGGRVGVPVRGAAESEPPQVVAGIGGPHTATTTGDSPPPTTLQLSPEMHDAPTARYGQCMVQHKEQLYIWGGTHGTNYPTDMHRFDLISKRWFGVAMTGEQPTGRYRHQALVRNDCMYVFGGSGTARYGDVFEFDLCTNTWKRLVCSGVGHFQQGRYAHAAVLHDSKVLVYGGNDGRRTNDLLIFDIDTQEWSQLPVHALEAPPGRDFHAAVTTARQPVLSALSDRGPDSWSSPGNSVGEELEAMVIFGGSSGHTRHNDASRFVLSSAPPVCTLSSDLGDRFLKCQAAVDGVGRTLIGLFEVAASSQQKHPEGPVSPTSAGDC
ncbi:kelch repeat protein, putative [Perkinsus marinus ATCC 50983]|uniref:Kelch repeat protein, putative n=1 Tax=Perkinsus marinus (strain ATCC 50983 / TXsc) TaxID=423536 RepID=C5LUY9_PERM5|nr:kelch repeat protein, putative [Perkinsus marinus ATCC 50983]EEQ99489.1 kelch repeat protein, putative [Perkinsus marinus ATCC 50983]|eukprot:XP_002766772.1 kelch repeat protein, putative [Perkinsus marinus ATCC 50983]